MVDARRGAATGIVVTLLCASSADASSLKLTAGKLPKRVSAGATASVKVTAVNRGKQRSEPVTLRWYLSRDGRRDRADVALGGKRRVRALKPGAKSAAVTRVRVPVKVRPGTYRLLVCAKKRCTTLGRIKVGPPRPDLVIAALGTPPGSVGAGDRLSVEVDVRNAGGAATGASRVGLQLRRGSAVTELADGRAVPALKRGGSSAASTSGRIPGALAAGRYRLAACADADRSVKEASERNNCKIAGSEVTVTTGGGGGGGGGGPTGTETPTPGPTETATATPTPGVPVGDPLDPSANPTTITTDFGDSTAFLYQGADAPQEGITAGAIERQRVAVLRGRVVDRAGMPVGGVRVAVLGHPDLGHVRSRADGGYDLAVNGGGPVTLSLTRVGYLSVQRQEDVPWQDYVTLEDIAMTQVDSAASAITAPSPDWQAHQSTPATDGDAERRTTLLFPPDLHATMTLPDGSTEPLPTMTVRATEFTTGADGDEAMPGDLPPQTGYTFATEYSVDEAVDAGATGVSFDRPVIAYTTDFLGFPVGDPVPAGTYEQDRGLWTAKEDGIVIELLDATGAIDADGDELADSAGQLTALGITDGERTKLASLFAPGTVLWRVPETHFSAKDYNWGVAIPPDAVAPNGGAPSTDPTVPNCEASGSVIGCESQILGEQLPVTGTPYGLVYNSQRVPGRVATRMLRIRLTGGTVPASLTDVSLRIEVAGRHFAAEYPPTPGQTTEFTWDGKDAYGRPVQGWVTAEVRIGFTYDGIYGASRPEIRESFGAFAGYDITAGPDGRGQGRRAGGVVRVNTRRPITIWREWRPAIGTWDQRGVGLGGWSLSTHHVYDPDTRLLMRGDGTTQSGDALAFNAIAPAAGYTGGGQNFGYNGDEIPAVGAKLSSPWGLATGPDGSLYIADQGNGRVRRVDPDGDIHSIYSKNGQPTEIAVAPNGDVVIADSALYRIYAVSPDGTERVIAGTGVRGDGGEGEGGPATAADLDNPTRIAAAPDGSVYFLEPSGAQSNLVRRIAPDGTLTTVVGGGPGPTLDNPRGEGLPGTEIRLAFIFNAIAVGPDGTLYVTDVDNGGAFIRSFGPDGKSHVFAGGTPASGIGDGGPASNAIFTNPNGMTVTPDGRMLVGEYGRVRMISADGRIRTIAGVGTIGSTAGDGGAANAAHMGRVWAVAMGPDETIYLTDRDFHRVRSVKPVLPGASLEDIVLPSPDGNEVYRFDRVGRHLSTVDSLTGATTQAFGYDGAGRLADVTDRNGLETTIEHDGDGAPTAIVAPGGQRTALGTNAAGWLTSVTDPGGNATDLSPDAGGLLTALTTPRGNTHTYGYDAIGLLERDDDPAGGSSTLARTDLPDGWEVTRTTALGRVTTYRYEALPDGTVQRRVTDPAGAVTDWTSDPDGSERLERPDGTVDTWTDGPDPRFGMLVPRWKTADRVTPSPGPEWHATRSITHTGLPVNPDTYAIDATVNGDHWTLVYDGASRTMTRTSPEGRKSTQAWDAKARLKEVTVAEGETPVTLSYDDRGNLSALEQGTRSLTYDYDARDRLRQQTDALGREWHFDYDAADRRVQTVTPGGHQYDVGRDAAGNATSLDAPGGVSTAMTYDGLDRLASTTAPGASGAVAQTYDADRAWLQRTLPGGRHVDAGYDDGGRLESVTSPEAAIGVTYAGATDRPASVTRTPAGGGTAQATAFEYQGGLLTRRLLTGTAAADAKYTYGPSLDVTSWTLDGGAARSLARDDDGLTVADGPLTIERDGAGRIKSEAAGSAAITSDYDALGRLRHRTVTTGAGQAFKLDLDYDDADRVTSKTEKEGSGAAATSTYGYDDDGHLESVDGAATEDYTYDARGNRVTGPSAGTTSTFDDQDRLTAHAGVTYTNDADGFMTGRGAATFDYGTDGELESATVGGTTVTYAYDDLGRRVARTQGGATEQYLYLDPEDPWRVTASKAGSTTTVYHYDDEGRLVFLERGATTYVVATDQVGSVRLVADASSGAVARQATYTAFGVPTVTGSFDLPIGFAGGLEDPLTGLVRFGQRDYDPQTGRWTARDPALYAAGQFNLYAYLDGDPVNGRDPTGLGDGPMYPPGGPPKPPKPNVCSPAPSDRNAESWQWKKRAEQASEKANQTDDPNDYKIRNDLWRTWHQNLPDVMTSDGKPTSGSAFASSAAATKA